jgi:hypothetical protein
MVGEAQMSAWIATTLAIAIMAVTAGSAVNAGPCVQKRSYYCVDTGLAVDLNSVPDIIKKIVSEEPIAQNRNKPAIEPATSTPYSGPIVGITSGKQAPTIGYSWSLD